MTETNMTDLEYKVGNLGPGTQTSRSKFVIYKANETTLEIYALRAGNRHSVVAESFALDPKKVLGGGSYDLICGGLFFNDYSADFGSVPNEVVMNFEEALIVYFRNQEIQMDDVGAEMTPEFRANKQEWKSLGFNV